jgi:molybdopterin-containing oxidoreductase family membrane subunit
VAPRFLGSAFTAGPGILIIAFQIIRSMSGYRISDRAIHMLRNIVTASLLINLFLLTCETFKEFYAASAHSSSARYLFFGLEHHGQYYGQLVPWIWTAIGMQLAAGVILIIPPVARRILFLNIACVLANIGIWIEKGMGMVVPGFVPTPQGTVVEYTPSWSETVICLGIWAFGLLLFSWMLHLAIPIMMGQFRAGRTPEPPKLDVLQRRALEPAVR